MLGDNTHIADHIAGRRDDKVVPAATKATGSAGGVSDEFHRKPEPFQLFYKVTFGAGQPDQIPPHIRRVYLDAWPRARADEHVSYYRKIIKYKATAHSVETAPNLTDVDFSD